MQLDPNFGVHALGFQAMRIRAHATLSCLAALVTLAGARAFADEPAPPPPVLSDAPLRALPPEPDTPEGLYHQTVHLMATGQYDLARRVAEEALAEAPEGPLAPALNWLLARIDERIHGVGPSFAYRLGPTGARAYTLTVGALVGLGEALGVGAAAGLSNGTLAGVGALGLVVGVGLPLLGFDFIARPAVAPHLLLGSLAGGGIGLDLVLFTNPSGNLGGWMIAAGVPAGAVLGALLGGLADVTEGDAGAALAGMLHLTLASFAFSLAVPSETTRFCTLVCNQGLLAGVLLSAGTVGLVSGEIANRWLRWSEARWGLIELGGILGASLGGVVAAVAGTNTGVTGGLVGGGDLVGLAVAMVATLKMIDEGPPGYEPPATPPAPVQPAPPAAAATPNPFVPTLIPPAAAYTLRF